MKYIHLLPILCPARKTYRSLIVTLFMFVPILSAHAVEFTVNDPEDLPDVNPGDGVALTERETTSLRAAIEEANCLPGKDYINNFVYPVFEEYAGLVLIRSPLYISDELVISIKIGVLYCVACGPNQYRAIEVTSGVHLEMVKVYVSGGGPPSHAIYADRGATMYINPGAEVSLFGCELQSGVATEEGGGIYVDRAMLYVHGESISGYSQGDGGGIYNDHGFVYGEGQYFIGIAEGRGGSLFNDHGYVVLAQSTDYGRIERGIAGVAGGGIYSDGGYVVADSVSVSANDSSSGAGFFLTNGARLDMLGSALISNDALTNGGAIYVDGASVYAAMCTFDINTANQSGGAIFMKNGEATLINCTITKNTASESGTGGGIAVDPDDSPVCMLGNTILSENEATGNPATADITGPIVSLGHNLIGISDGGSGFVASDLLGTLTKPLSPLIEFTTENPTYPATPQYVFMPQPSSPVIDAGDTSLLFNPNFVGSPCYDARLFCCPRVRNGAVDIGAIEVQEGSIDLTCDGTHSADYDHNGRIGLSEVLRIVQFFNSGGLHCQSGTEDGYAPGPAPEKGVPLVVHALDQSLGGSITDATKPDLSRRSLAKPDGDTSCTAHSADYNPQDWFINLSELLRIIQLYNSGGYHSCPSSEDGFCVD